jgi:hypothetical protein
MATWILICFGAAIVLALALSVFAFQLSMRRYMDVRDFRAMRLALGELDDRLIALGDSHKRLRSRVGMRELRARRGQSENGVDESTSADEWKRQMRMKLHKGEIKP